MLAASSSLALRAARPCALLQARRHAPSAPMPLSLRRPAAREAAAGAARRSQLRSLAVSSSTSSSSPSTSSSFESFDSNSNSSSSSPPPRFTIHKIAGDGSCLFRALAQGAHFLNASKEGEEGGTATNSGSNSSAFSLGSSPSPPPLLEGPELLAAGFAVRRRICAALVRNREDVEPFLETPFHAYVEAMSTEGTWGGEPELAVAPEALGRPVCVYSRARDVSGGGGGGGGSGRASKSDLASLFFGDDIVKVSEYGVDQFEDTAPICLLFGGLHYDLLIVEG